MAYCEISGLRPRVLPCFRCGDRRRSRCPTCQGRGYVVGMEPYRLGAELGPIPTGLAFIAAMVGTVLEHTPLLGRRLRGVP